MYPGRVSAPIYIVSVAKIGQHRLPPEDRLTLRAALACVLPSDDGPGADETSAGNYVERVLMEVLDDATRERFQEGLRLLESIAQNRHGRPFRHCPRTAQDEVLTRLQQIPHRLPQQFLALLIHAALQGFLCDPVHGGNHEGLGWAYLCLPRTADPARP